MAKWIEVVKYSKVENQIKTEIVISLNEEAKDLLGTVFEELEAFLKTRMVPPRL